MVRGCCKTTFIAIICNEVAYDDYLGHGCFEDGDQTCDRSQLAVTLKTFGDKTESRHCYQFATEWGCFVIVCHLTVINPWESQTCGHLHAQKSPLINSDIVASGRLFSWEVTWCSVTLI